MNFSVLHFLPMPPLLNRSPRSSIPLITEIMCLHMIYLCSALPHSHSYPSSRVSSRLTIRNASKCPPVSSFLRTVQSCPQLGHLSLTSSLSLSLSFSLSFSLSHSLSHTRARTHTHYLSLSLSGAASESDGRKSLCWQPYSFSCSNTCFNFVAKS